MAASKFITDIVDTALTVGGWSTLLQLSTPANLRVKILSWGIFFQGVVSTDTPITVQLFPQSNSAGMIAGDTIKVDAGLSVTSSINVFKSAASATEPADPGGSQIAVANVHPQSGYQLLYPFGQELIQSGNSIIGLRVFAAQANNASAYIMWEE